MKNCLEREYIKLNINKDKGRNFDVERWTYLDKKWREENMRKRK